VKKSLIISLSIIFVGAGYMLVRAQGNGNQDMMKKMQESMMQNMMGSMMGNPSPKAVSKEKSNLGKAIFNDTKLGNNGKSCNTCHSKVGRKPLDGRKVVPYLSAYIQYCYNNGLKGRGIIPKDKLDGIESYFAFLEK